MKNDIWTLDIEADGLLPTVTYISTFNITNNTTGESRTYTKDSVLGYEDIPVGIKFVRRLLEKGSEIVMHNCQYDIGVLHKLYGLDLLKYYKQIHDTMILSQLMYTNIQDEDDLNENTPMPYNMQHGLEAWGMRLGDYKHKSPTDYTTVTENLIKYLEQDVNLTIKLFKFLRKQPKYPKKSVRQVEVWNTLECALYPIYGWKIDTDIKDRLMSKYSSSIASIDVELSTMFDPYYKLEKKHYNGYWDHLFNIWDKIRIKIPFEKFQRNDKVIKKIAKNVIKAKLSTKSEDNIFENLKAAFNNLTITKRNSSKWVEVDRFIPNSVGKTLVCDLYYTKSGKPKTNKKWERLIKQDENGGTWYRRVPIVTTNLRDDISLQHFKAGSRQSIATFFKRKYGYEFSVLSDTDNPVLNEDVLGNIDLKEAPLLKKRFKMNKDLSMLKGLEKNMIDDRAYGNIKTLGATSTGRSSATGGITVGFNLQQQSSEEEYRRMFTASDGRIFVTADLSSAELMLQGIVMKPYDNGKFLDMLLKGNKKDKTDLHSVNGINLGISRGDAKVVYYASSYGASGLLIAYNLNPSDDEIECTTEEYDTELKKLKKKSYVVAGEEYVPLKKGVNLPITSRVVKLSIWGTRLKNTLSDSLDGYKELLKDLENEIKETGGIKSLDGRFITVDSPHKALNYVLQSSNAVLTKLWKFFSYTHMMKLHPIVDTWLPLAVVHDEVNIECDPEVVDDMVESLRIGLLKANKYLKLPANIECDIGVGSNENNTWSMH